MKTNAFVDNKCLLTNPSDPALSIQAEANVGINAHHPGNKLFLFNIQTTIKIVKVPIMESKLLIILFFI